MKEIEPDIFVNDLAYYIDDNHGQALVHSQNLSSLRAYAKREGYVSGKGYQLVHRQTTKYLSLIKEAGAPPWALQPGSNLWYPPKHIDYHPQNIHRITARGSVQEFEGFVEFGWRSSHTMDFAHQLEETEFQEVSVEFLVSGEAEMPSEAYWQALMQVLV